MRNRIIYTAECVMVALWALPIASALAEKTESQTPKKDMPSQQMSELAELPEPSAIRVSKGNAKVDVTTITSPEWKEAIRRTSESVRRPQQVTLFRVRNADGSSPQDDKYGERALVVNGQRLFVPGQSERAELDQSLDALARVPAPELDRIQLMGVKLVPYGQPPGGGGLYQQISSGEFVQFVHINSARRKSGRDPVTIGSLMHHQVELAIPVPPAGQLAIGGDIILLQPKQVSLGRLVIKVTSDGDAKLDNHTVQIAPVVVGGPYGPSFKLGPNGICSIDRLSPGRYRIVLPGFQTNDRSNRFEVEVKPHELTYLKFSTVAPNTVKLDHEKHVPYAAAE